MSILDIAYNVVADYPGGAKSLAPRMGKSAGGLSHEVAGFGISKFGLVDAVKVTQLSGDFRMLYEFAESCGHKVVPREESASGKPGECMYRFGDVNKEYADVCNGVIAALADGVVTDNELKLIEKECGELMAQLQALRSALAMANTMSKVQAGVL